jgi:hypothetical protein
VVIFSDTDRTAYSFDGSTSSHMDLPDSCQVCNNFFVILCALFWVTNCDLLVLINSQDMCHRWPVTCDLWHVTCDLWPVTSDMWPVTCDLCHVTCNWWLQYSLRRCPYVFVSPCFITALVYLCLLLLLLCFHMFHHGFGLFMFITFVTFYQYQ